MVVQGKAPRGVRTSRVLALTLVLACTAGACGARSLETTGPPPSGSASSHPKTPAHPATTVPVPGSPSPTTTGAAPPRPSPDTTRSAAPSKPRALASDGKPRRARLSIPALDIENLEVEPHRGSPDDANGTRIQNGGIAASPYGPKGGVGPGGIGNHIITAHRLSSTRAFLDLPELRVGAKVQLDAGGKRYTYKIVQTRTTSFRSRKSLAAQSAPVPGRPGVRATTAMITLSTCRTPEDHAEGNYWSDKFGNPEHRIEKIGELVAITSG